MAVIRIIDTQKKYIRSSFTTYTKLKAGLNPQNHSTTTDILIVETSCPRVSDQAFNCYPQEFGVYDYP